MIFRVPFLSVKVPILPKIGSPSGPLFRISGSPFNLGTVQHKFWRIGSSTDWQTESEFLDALASLRSILWVSDWTFQIAKITSESISENGTVSSVSNVKFSNVKCQMSNVKWQMSIEKCHGILMSNVKCYAISMSNVKGISMSNIKCHGNRISMPNVKYHIINIKCRMPNQQIFWDLSRTCEISVDLVRSE